MKKMLILAMVCLAQISCAKIFAQTLSDDMQQVYDACVEIRSAAGSGSTTALQSANKKLKSADTKYFGTLRCLDTKAMNLDGHLVFDFEFVDSLIVNREVYKFASKYVKRGLRRGASSSGKILIKTCGVKAGASTKHRFVARDKQELAVVTEPGGRVSMRIHDKTNDKWYNDTKDFKQGRETRIAVFNLPKETKNTIEVEIINTTDKDISFVIISNGI